MDSRQQERARDLSRRTQLEQLLQADPDDVFLNYALAKQCVSDGEVAEGLERFARTIEISPDYVPAYFQAAQVHAQQGDSAQARETVTAGIEVAKRTGDAHALGEMTEFLGGL